MKKYIISLMVVLSLFFSSVSITDASIFTSKNTKTPYDCSAGKCGLQPGIDKAKTWLDDSIKKTWKASDYIQEVVAYVLTFLYIITVIIIIYAGFIILTAAGDEEKVTKWKKIILFALIGLVVIYLAGPITDFIIRMFNRP